jgi:hypothetical protein
MPDDKWEELREQLRRAGNAIPEDLRDWLRNLRQGPGPAEPGYSQDLRRDIANAMEQSERSSEKTAVADHPPPETPAQAARALIAWFAGGLAFESVHAFADASYWAAVGYGLGAIAVAIADYNLKALLAGSPRLTKSLNNVASDARWWVGAAMLSLLIISISPYIEQRRFPYAHWFGYEPSPTSTAVMPTFLRLQFNASNDKPQKIDGTNVEWAWDSFLSSNQTLKPPCPPGSIIITSDCSTLLTPQYNIQNNKIWIIFLTFIQSLPGKNEVQVDSHGATLPEWHSYFMSSRMVYVEFRGDLSRMVLDIRVVPKQ